MSIGGSDVGADGREAWIVVGAPAATLEVGVEALPPGGDAFVMRLVR